MTAKKSKLGLSIVSVLDCELEKLPEGWEKKPCPFCPSTEIRAFKYPTAVGDRYGIVCMGCLAVVNSGYWQSAAQALFQGWNQRSNDETAGVMAMLDG